MKNPTKTRTIETAWLREINKRWRELAKRIRDRLNQPITNAEFAMSAEQQRSFMVWLEAQINELLLDDGDNWQAKYQLSSYERALDRNRALLRAQGADLQPTPREIQQAAGLTAAQFTATPSLVAGAVTQMPPIHQDALEFLFTRSYESLNGWTDAFAKETRQILRQGVEEGQNTRKVSREIMKRLDVSRSRARVIAQTETIQAYQQSSTNEAKRAEEELGETILMRWKSAEDSKVRPLHASWNGTAVTPAQNARRINQSPWNCRCAQAPVIKV